MNAYRFSSPTLTTYSPPAVSCRGFQQGTPLWFGHTPGCRGCRNRIVPWLFWQPVSVQPMPSGPLRSLLHVLGAPFRLPVELPSPLLPESGRPTSVRSVVLRLQSFQLLLQLKKSH